MRFAEPFLIGYFRITVRCCLFVRIQR